MGRTAFFLDDALSNPEDPVSIIASAMATSNTSAPVRNALDDRPRHVWMNGEGVWAPSSAVAGDAYSAWIDIEEGSSGNTYSTIMQSGPFTAIQFAASVAAQINGNSNLSLTYTVTYHPTSGRFIIAASGSFDIKWKTGTHGSDNTDSHVGPWMGFSDSADSGAGTSHAGTPRYDTELQAIFKCDLLTTPMKPSLWAAILQGDERTVANGGTDFTDVKIYGHSSDLGLNRRAWEAAATYQLTFSSRPAEDENKIQVAFASDGTAMGADYWFFSWQYFDQSDNHGAGIIKALTRFTTSDRQITQLSGHGLDDPTIPLGLESYYPVQNLLRWIAPLNFNSWGAADYRNVVEEVVRRGRSRGLVWALRWDEILDLTYDADDEADKGFLLYASLRDYSQASYQGRGSTEFISGELTIEQVR